MRPAHRAQGFGIVIVTHKLGEVRAIADRVTVLRGGRTVLARRRRPTTTTTSELIEAMVGRAVPALPAEREPVPPSDVPALELAA